MAEKRMAPGKADVPYDIRERSFLFGVRVIKWTTSRKEARESRFWVRTICAANNDSPEGQALVQESTELINILSTLIKKNKDSLKSD